MAAASSNPAFRNNPAFTSNQKVAAKFTPVSDAELEEMYGRPAATPRETGRMTYENTVQKVVICFAVLVVGAVIGWFVPILFVPALIVGFVLALVNIFKKTPSPALILSYALVEGVFVGGISSFYSELYSGIVPQAVFGTLGIVAVTLALFASGKVRASKRATKVFLIAMIGYAVYSLVNVILMLTGVTDSMYGLSGSVKLFGFLPLGLVIGVLVIIMGAYSLVLDFDAIQQGVRRGAPKLWGWQGAFGIMVTVVWLYLEVLRLIGIARN